MAIQTGTIGFSVVQKSFLSKRTPYLSILRVIMMSAICLLSIGACGGGGGGGSDDDNDVNDDVSTLSTTELKDPTPGTGDFFGSELKVLANGNIVVGDSQDSSIVLEGGAVHLFNGSTQERIASFYGDDQQDRFGATSITELTNGNFVIASESDDVAGIVNAGSVILVNGATGAQIGTTIVGNDAGDSLGKTGIRALTNGNFVIISEEDDEGGMTNVGSIMLIDGDTGAQISTSFGDSANDKLGANGLASLPSGFAELPNGNFVVASGQDGASGSVMLISGAIGTQIGSTISSNGDNGITALPNGNFVVASRTGASNEVNIYDGAVSLVGTGFTGGPDSFLGSGGIQVLSNNNFLIISPEDDVNGVTNSGSVILVDGTTGNQIGATIAGDEVDDQVGFPGLTVLSNGNFVVSSFDDDVNGLVDAGSVKLYDGSAAQIGSTIAGDEANEGMGSVNALPNGNFLVSSIFDTVDGKKLAGSVMLFDGDTGDQIGATISGDDTDDTLGIHGVTALPNGNYVIVSGNDNVEDLESVGSVKLVSGESGELIQTIFGNDEFDHFGDDNNSDAANNSSVIPVPGGNFIVVSTSDKKSETSALIGSITLIDGTSGKVDAQLFGEVAGDFLSATVAVAQDESFYVLGLPSVDNEGREDSGIVSLVTP